MHPVSFLMVFRLLLIIYQEILLYTVPPTVNKQLASQVIIEKNNFKQ